MIKYLLTLMWVCVYATELLSMEISIFSGQETTQRDQQLSQMLLKLKMMEACKETAECIQGFNVPNCKPETMFAHLQSELKDEIRKYAQSRDGVSKIDLWQIFNACQNVVDAKLKSLPKTFEPPLPVSKRTLLALAQEVVAANARLTEDGGLKLETLFRDEASARFKKLLEASHTLRIPLGRALKKADLVKRNFQECFLAELQKGYWHDETFTEAMRYLKEYFRYEYLVALANQDLVKKYPELVKTDAKTHAHRFLVNYILMYVVQPFLKENGVKETEIKAFTGGDHNAIIYGFLEKLMPFADISPTWNLIANIIIQEHCRASQNASTCTEKTSHEIQNHGLRRLNREGTRVAINDLIESLRFAFSRAEKKLSYTLLCGLMNEYITQATNYPGIIVPTTDLVKKYVDAMISLPVENKYINEEVNNTFVKLQEVIRASEHWHSCKHDAIFERPYDGNPRPYLEKFSDANWEGKTDIFVRLADIVKCKKSDEMLLALLKKLGTTFAGYVEYLEETDIIRILQVFHNLNFPELFDLINQFLAKIEQYSDDPVGLKELRSNLASTMVPSANGFFGRTKKSLKSDVLFKWNNGKKQSLWIHFPIEGGRIGQTVKALQKSSHFVNVEPELLMLIARLAEPENLLAKKYLYKQGDDADSLALIVEGELEIYVKDNNQPVAKLGAGQTVGDMSLFNEQAKRSATVKAGKVTTKIYKISFASFKGLMMKEQKLMKIMVDHLAEKARNGQKSLMEEGLFTVKDERSPLECICHDLTYKLSDAQKMTKPAKGSAVFKKGELAKKLYYIYSGELILSHQASKAERITKRYVDELAFFLPNGSYSFSAQVETKDCTLRCISRRKFDELSRENPELLWKLAAVLEKMIDDNNHRLKNTQGYQLQLACENNDLSEAKEALKNGLDIDAPCPVLKKFVNKTRPLHVAAHFNSLLVLELLLKEKADVNVMDEHGNTPAHIAAIAGNRLVLERLSNEKANFCSQNRNNESPYKLAIKNHHDSTAEFLKSYDCVLDDMKSSGAEL